MAWLEIAGNVDQSYVELLSEIMTAQGALAVTFSANDQQEVFQEEVGVTRYWQNTLLRGLFVEDADQQAVIRQIKSSDAYFQSVQFDVAVVEEQDWVRLTQQQFQPILIDERLWICPSWVTLDDERLQVKLDPGLAFGTGTHPTTKLCLRWLAANDIAGKTLIDYGCGSGVLALGALALGAKKVYAVDHDQQAIEATINNANLNRCKLGESIVPLLDDAMPSLHVPCIIANILARPLCQLVEVFASLLMDGGRVVLSGIQRADIAAIRVSYSTLFHEVELVYCEDWARMEWVKIAAAACNDSA